MKAPESSRKRVDARALGALCDECPFNGNKPVRAEISAHPRLTVVVDSPGETEVTHDKPLVGAAGRLFDKALELDEIRREDLSITHAVMCRPPHDVTPAQWKTALRCCKPRLAAELKDAKTVLALGDRAQQALIGKAKVMDWMGAVTPGAVFKPKGQVWAPLKTKPLPPDDALRFDHLEAVSTFNPGYCIANPQYNIVLRKHLRRVWALANGKLPKWKWCKEDITDGPGLRAALWEIFLRGGPVACDTETTSLDPQKAVLLNVGIADDSCAVSVEWQTASVATKELVKAILHDETITKEYWNAAYDLQILYYQEIEHRGPWEDWQLAHLIVAPGVSHKLTHA